MKKTSRLLLVLLVLVVSTLLLYPTIKWYLFVPSDLKELALTRNEQIRDYAVGQAVRDVKSLKSMVAEDRNCSIPSDFSYLEKTVGKKDTLYDLLVAFDSEQDLLDAVEARYRDELLSIKKLSSRVLQLGLDLRGGMSVLLQADTDSFAEKNGYVPSSSELEALLKDDIAILNSRIDQFGVTEPDIRMQGSSQILIEMPGEADPERVNTFLRGKGSLSFHEVDSVLTNRVNEYYSLHPSEAFDEDGHIVVPDFIPEDRMLVGYYEVDEYGMDSLRSFAVLYDEVILDGSHLVGASTSTDQMSQRPVVNFQLDSEGGKIFYAYTSSHIGDSLAIVMDGKAKSIASISAGISENVQLSGGFTKEEAEDIAITLKTTALPIDLEVVSQQGVGASLGDDAVVVALKAIIVGILLVVVFMFAYYSWAGLIADLALLMNFYMMISILSAMNFTLTLTSIAGLVLTLGMAIDANVIIYERIKEETRDGKLFFEAIHLGFGRAFWTILDSNVTTIIAGVVLSILGSSSVKGFANTLTIGVACSLFTSLFVSHLIFDFIVPSESMKSVKMSWRRNR